MSWHTGPLALFDIESTGVDPLRDRIVTASVILAGGPKGRADTEWLVDPGIPIPDGAAEVHGITTEQAQRDGGERASVIPAIGNLLVASSKQGRPIVGHNVTYDLTMLWAELLRCGSEDLAAQVAAIAPVIDTMVLDKWADPWRPKAPTNRRRDPARCGSRKLIDAARVWGITLTEAEAHSSTGDALAAGRLAWSMARNTPGLQGSAVELHTHQIEWKAEQAASLGEWLVKQGKTDDVAREWPLQKPPADWSPDQLPAQFITT